MMSGSNKRSRSATHNAESAHYNENMGSDENILIPDGKSCVTTKVRAGDVAEGDSVGEERGRGASLDDSHILRTVEVTRVYESN